MHEFYTILCVTLTLFCLSFMSLLAQKPGDATGALRVEMLLHRIWDERLQPADTTDAEIARNVDEIWNVDAADDGFVIRRSKCPASEEQLSANVTMN